MAAAIPIFNRRRSDDTCTHFEFTCQAYLVVGVLRCRVPVSLRAFSTVAGAQHLRVPSIIFSTMYIYACVEPVPTIGKLCVFGRSAFRPVVTVFTLGSGFFKCSVALFYDLA